MSERAGGVVAPDRLDLRGAGVDGARDRRAGLVHADDDQQVGARRVGHPGDLAGEATRSPSTVARGASRGACRARASTVQPSTRSPGGRAGSHAGRTSPAATASSDSSPAACSSALAGSSPSSGAPRQHAAALLRHEHRVEGAQPGAAVILVDQQAGPAGLDHRRPQVGQRAALERLAGALDRLHARKRAARRLAQELLLVGQCEVHREDLLSGLGVALVEQ